MHKRVKKWRQLSSKTVFSSAYLSLHEDVAMLPNGTTASYIRYAPGQAASVAVLALNNKKELLLQQEYNYPPDEVLWQLPGGTVEAGESVEAAALRELSEESGYSARNLIVMGSYFTQHRRSDQIQYVVLCRDIFDRKLPEDPDEFIAPYWLPFEKIEAMVKNGEFKNMNLLAALYLFQHSPYFKNYR